MKNHPSRSKILQKQAKLQEVNAQLKKEFFGIDEVIDEIMENFSSWYLFPEFQHRPCVINLWGMTGTGKTSLIKRLAALLELDKLLYSFEMSKRRGYVIEDTLERISSERDGEPIMILLDEFQHLRAYDEEQRMLDDQRAQLVWKLVDSGIFELYNGNYLDQNAQRKLIKLNRCLEAGVLVKNGEVVEGKELFIRMSNMNTDDGDNYFSEDPAYIKKRYAPPTFDAVRKKSEKRKNKLRIRFISIDLIQEIAQMLENKEYGMACLIEEFDQLDGWESLRYIRELIDQALAIRTVNCSKAIIFVCGNLDAAYPMSSYLSPDIDADIFYEESKKINLADIKDCLSDFLRQEQIARLGNTHIIYPALSSKAYKQLIVQQLDKIKSAVMEEHEIQLKFEQSVYELIYTEGVYPTQGSRPVLSTIRELIQSKLGSILGEIFLHNWKSLKEVIIRRKQQELNVRYHSAQRKLGEKRIPLQLKLDSMRQVQEGEKKVVIAVHEAGHCLVHRILNGKSPRLVLSSTASNQMAGITLTDEKPMYSRSYAVKQLAVLMAGFCAEKQIFGVDAITSGSGSDLFRAEKMAVRMTKDWGFQHFENSRTLPSTIIRKRETGHESAQLLDEAMTVATDVLREHEKALLKLSDVLIHKNCLHREEIEEIFSEFLEPKPHTSTENKIQLTAYQSQFERKLKTLKT